MIARLATGFAISLIVLIPCFWLPQVASNDLASHTYNVWLIELVERGEAPGLYIAPRKTNILFDYILTASIAQLGLGPGQRVAVSVCVLALFWGAFTLLRHVSGKAPAPVLIVVGMLCYGFVFHMGFFNFYLSAGLCLAALGLLWRPNWRRSALAVPLLAVASLAHILPAIWVIAQATYVYITRRVRIRQRIWLAVGGIFGILGLRLIIQLSTGWRLRPSQLLLWSGADQLLVFGQKYWIPTAALTIWWLGSMAFAQAQRRGRVSRSLVFHLVALNALGLALIPSDIHIPGYAASFNFMSERMTLLEGVLVCALVAGYPLTRWLRWSAPLIAGLFFTFLYVDQRAVVNIEEEIYRLVRTLPPRSRVLSGVCTDEGRYNFAYHTLDRACIGHCFSYGNYEPASGYFRLRARPDNGIVVADTESAYDLESASYTVREPDLPAYRIEHQGHGKPLVVKHLAHGDRLPAPCQ